MSPGTEKIVWQSRGGGITGYSPLAAFGWTLLGLASLGACVTPLALLTAPALTADSLFGLMGNLIWSVLALAIVVPTFVLPRTRPTFFLTPTTLLARRPFGGWRTVPLEGLVSVERKIVIYHTRYGPRQLVTHRIAMTFASGRHEDVGPIAEVDALIELLDSVIVRHVSLDALPGVRGELAPAEARGDVFLAARTETGGMAYGPLFVGPTRVLRFTEVLEPALLARLYTVVGGAIDAEEAEVRAVDLLRHPGTGHVIDIPRDLAKIRVDRDVAFLRLSERAEEVRLAPPDADRLRVFLARAV